MWKESAMEERRQAEVSMVKEVPDKGKANPFRNRRNKKLYIDSYTLRSTNPLTTDRS